MGNDTKASPQMSLATMKQKPKSSGKWILCQPTWQSYVLQTYILIFRRDGTSPLYITPVLDTQETPTFLVYDASGPGHYDSAIYTLIHVPPMQIKSFLNLLSPAVV